MLFLDSINIQLVIVPGMCPTSRHNVSHNNKLMWNFGQSLVNGAKHCQCLAPAPILNVSHCLSWGENNKIPDCMDWAIRHSYTASLPLCRIWLGRAGATTNSFRRAHVAIFQLVGLMWMFGKSPNESDGRSDASWSIYRRYWLNNSWILLHCRNLNIECMQKAQ